MAYHRYHRREFISPDPLEIVLEYPELRDREIAGFVAAALATGRVGGIIGAVRQVLDRLPSPFTFLANGTTDEIRSLFASFSYRFFNGRQVSGLLIALKRVVAEYGSLESCVADGMSDGVDHAQRMSRSAAEPIVRGIGHLSRVLVRAAEGDLEGSILVARPDLGSACKRLFLFLRWMVRCDAVDPGGWTKVTPAQLLVPVDTHMLAVCRSLGITAARQPSLRVAREITDAFRSICPEDPVRYDFCLTRLGIHPDVRNADLGREVRSFGAELSGSA